MKVHILMNNYVRSSKLLAQHGLSFFIEAHNKKIIFDAGQTDAFIDNAKILGLNLSEIEAVVLSHGHYDHTGGLHGLVKLNKTAEIYMHPYALKEKFSLKNGMLRHAGIPFELESIGLDQERIKFNTKAKYIFDDILISGEIQRSNDFETRSNSLMMKEDDNLKHDDMIDEQMLIIREKRGIVIILGCSHPGIANCIEYASSLNPNEKILAVIGGLHLKNANKERINSTIEYLKSKNIEKIIPLHCTGFGAMSEMKRVFNDKCIIAAVGDVLKIV